MGIHFDAAQSVFRIETKNTSYIMGIFKEKYLVHLYWGEKLALGGAYTIDTLLSYEGRAFSPSDDPADDSYSTDTLPMEYPCHGSADLRGPAFAARYADGSGITKLTYTGHTITRGKPCLPGLPAVYAEGDGEAETLAVTLQDELTGLCVTLTYTAFEGYDAITRSVAVQNKGTAAISLEAVASASIDFPDIDFDFLHLHGAWARERHMETCPLPRGEISIDSKRGASSHQHNPFMALLRKGSTETHGDVYGFSLVYSGNFRAGVETDQYDMARAQIGINPFGFGWLLNPGESFQAPEAVLVYASDGLGGLSRTYHRLYRERLCRGRYRDTVRPIVANNWEATYFDFDEERILALAKDAKALGAELMVLDDGWFGKRENDRSSLGDWFPNPDRLPNGLASLADKVEELGMRFGLWFEPEMISPDSELYRQHPDWCLHVNGRTRSEGRHQCVLDLSRGEVCAYVTQTLRTILAGAKISYVKWDMNRHMTEVGSPALPPERQKETAHRYMLGLYSILETLTTAFPDVLFESCSGGGGRFDPGMLHYMPQTWASDDTDAMERVKIQHGTSIVYPPCTMGAHLSASPNHITGRSTSYKTRAEVAFTGQFGFELDFATLSDAEKEAVTACVAQYRAIRHIIQLGDMYRLQSPFEGNIAAWMFVSADKREAVLFTFRLLAKPNEKRLRMRLAGLDSALDYVEEAGGNVCSGDFLMKYGLAVTVGRDFDSDVRVFRAR